jgi:PAS domain S-box-containing protein
MHLRAIVDHAADGILTIDERGLIESYNPAAERTFGYTAAEVIGQNVKMLMPEPYYSEHDNYLRNYLHTGQAKLIGVEREVTGRRKDGSIFPLGLAVSEVRLGDWRLFIKQASAQNAASTRQAETAAQNLHELGQQLKQLVGQYQV